MVELVGGLAFATALVRYWKEVLAAVAIAFLALAAVGLMTVMQNWP